MHFSENVPICYGEGRDFAYGALEMGANAIKAVEVASKYCISCGMGIDVLSFEEPFMMFIEPI